MTKFYVFSRCVFDTGKSQIECSESMSENELKCLCEQGIVRSCMWCNEVHPTSGFDISTVDSTLDEMRTPAHD